ncbi:MAG TPA: hypothetical protein VGA15_15695 [Bradyrhizobium sp.]
MTATVERAFRDAGGVMTSFQAAKDMTSYLGHPVLDVLAEIARLPRIPRGRGRGLPWKPGGNGSVGKLPWRNAVTALEMLCQRALIAKPDRDCCVGDRISEPETAAGRIQPQMGKINVRGGSDRALEQSDQLENG